MLNAIKHFSRQNVLDDLARNFARQNGQEVKMAADDHLFSGIVNWAENLRHSSCEYL